MAWYNNLGDLVGDIKDIATGHNPTNNPAPVRVGNGISGGPPGTSIPQPGSTGQQISVNNASNVLGGSTMGTSGVDTSGGVNDAGGGSGTMDWLWNFLGNNAGSLLNAGGQAAQGIANYQQNAAALKERQDEFNKTFGLAQGNQGLEAASQLNRAPLADKGQYLALNAAAPTAFQPRDYTQGLGQIRGQAQGGAAAQLAANAQAAANYQAGDGGVDTNTLKMILAKLGYNQQTPQPIAGAPIPPGAGVPRSQ